MDPVTTVKAAQLVHTVGRSRTLRTWVVAVVVCGALMVAAAVIAPTAGVLVILRAATEQKQRQQAQTLNNRSCVDPGQAGVGNLTGEQVGNGAIIWQTVRARNLGDRAGVIALATALQESSLKNLRSGDRDSVGLFQQRPSQGWGTIQQIMNPTYATNKFLDVLVKTPQWETRPLTDIAQAVQRSAFPTAYAKWEATATGLVAHYKTSPASSNIVEANRQAQAGMCAPGGVGAMDCPASGLGVENGLTPDAVRVLRCGRQQFPQVVSWGGVGPRPANVDDDHQTGRALDLMLPGKPASSDPAGRALGDRIAAWAQQNSPQLGVKYVIWNEKIWSVRRNSEGWREYRSPSDRSGRNDTLAHRDHVHISVNGNSAGTGQDSGEMATPVEAYTITARFGQCGSMWANCHTGLDFAAPEGVPVRAVADGTVRFAGWGKKLGNLTVITNPDRTESWYAHQSRLDVKQGQSVKAGQQIGAVGSTGNVTGPHVHLEIRDQAGKPQDPERWYRARGVVP